MQCSFCCIENPDLTLPVGYEFSQTASRRTLFKNPLPQQKRRQRKSIKRPLVLLRSKCKSFFVTTTLFWSTNNEWHFYNTKNVSIDGLTPKTIKYCLSENTKQYLICKAKKNLILSLTRKIGTSKKNPCCNRIKALYLLARRLKLMLKWIFTRE